MERLIRAQNGEGAGNPLQCSCVENYTDRGARWATIHRVTKNWKLPSNWAKLIAEWLLSVILKENITQYAIFLYLWQHLLSDYNEDTDYQTQMGLKIIFSS